MKKLNKITLILVAVMGIIISGCGSDMKKAPLIIFVIKNNSSILLLVPNFLDMPEKESIEAYKKLRVKKITWIGRKKCHLEDKSGKNNDGHTGYGYQVKNRADCPPKDRLKESYEITLNTNYGTFLYNTGDSSTKRTQRVIGGENIWYVPVNYNNKGGKK